MAKETLVEKLDFIIDLYYKDSQYYTEIVTALEHYQDIQDIVDSSSLAKDGWEMIEAAWRDKDNE